MVFALLFLAGLGVYLWNYDYTPKSDRSPERSFEPPEAAPRLRDDALPRPYDPGSRGGPYSRGSAATAPPAVRLTAELRPPAAPFRSPAESASGRLALVLRNPASVSARALDGPLPSNLVEARIEYLGPEGRDEPQTVAAKPLPSPPGKAVVVELMPGRELALPVSLASFDLSRPGKYRLQVLYQPAVLAQEQGVSLDRLGVHAAALPAVCEFAVQALQK
jgi:hypothetical protein